MKGYKYLDKDMRAPVVSIFKYELGKEYEVKDESKLKICKYGFHFFDSLEDLFSYVFYCDQDIYEVEASGNIVCDGYALEHEIYTDLKFCSSRIKILKKLEKEDILKIINEEGLLNNERPSVRRQVARNGSYLDILINDENWIVRREVARQGYGLDILVRDEDIDVRLAASKSQCNTINIISSEGK